MKKKTLFHIALWASLALLAVTCNAPALINRATLVPTITTTPTAAAPQATTPLQMVGVSMHVKDDASTAPEVTAGSNVAVVLDFNPSQVVVQRDESGSILSTSWRPWEDHPVTEMRACFSMDGPCQPEGDWQPFASSLQYETPVEWLGPHEIHAAVQFRDREGNAVPAGDSAYAQPEELYQVYLSVISREDPELPVETLSPAVQTAQAATRSAFPVTGSVLIEEGRCCAGGKANTEIDLQVSFEAQSQAGDVKEMRVQTGGGCLRDAPSLDTDWEPFTPSKTYRTTLAINWVGYYVNVQYRDSAGNLSPVYCDDISLEGNP